MRSLLAFIISMTMTVKSYSAPVKPESELNWSRILFKVFIGPSSETEYCRGEEVITLENGILSKRTKYFKATNPLQTLQEENVRFALNTLAVADYEFRNYMNGESVDLKMPEPPIAAVKYLGPEISGKKRDQTNQKWTWTPTTIIGKTLHHFTVRQWDTIISGKKPGFDLFVPMKREAYAFQLRLGNIYKNPVGREVRIIHLEPSNWAIRQFVPEMAFHYEEFEGIPRLTAYEGATTIAVDGDDTKRVRIEFDYLK